jgi:hypothetical protein
MPKTSTRTKANAITPPAGPEGLPRGKAWPAFAG